MQNAENEQKSLVIAETRAKTKNFKQLNFCQTTNFQYLTAIFNILKQKKTHK